VQFRSDMTVELVRAAASDSDVVWSARVSTQGEKSVEAVDQDASRDAGLIRFLLRNRHGTPFEHNSMTFLVGAPIFVFREFQRHRIGWCLSGDSRIPVGPLRNGVTKPLKDVYRDWHEGVPDSLGRTRLLPSCRNLVTRTLNPDTGLIESARMVDVFRSGVKPLLRVTTAKGKSIKATADHRFWSQGSWVKAGDLAVGDVVSCSATVPVGPYEGVPRRLREGIQVWTSRVRDEVVAAVDSCHVCGAVMAREDLEVDHVVPVSQDLRLALDKDNLRPICPACHEVKSGVESWQVQRRPAALGARDERVVSIVEAGEEMTYDVEMPAPWHNFVADGFVVHNSYNEESGRYRELQPVFYVPGRDRPLAQVGKAGAYEFVDAGPETTATAVAATERACTAAYEAYQEMLAAGVAREVARTVLPVGTYSTMYATCNARSLMAFLSLRTKSEGARFPSFPQREIEMVADAMEEHFARLMPITHGAFLEAGRVCP
jgi:flavin-dependent thymidylate synthase